MKKTVDTTVIGGRLLIEMDELVTARTQELPYGDALEVICSIYMTQLVFAFRAVEAAIADLPEDKQAKNYATLAIMRQKVVRDLGIESPEKEATP